MNKRASLAAAAITVAAGLGLAAAGWATAETPAPTPTPSSAVTGTTTKFDRPSKPTLNPEQVKHKAELEAKAHAVAQISLKQLGDKIGRTPDQITAAAEKVSGQLNPTQQEAAAVKTGTKAERDAVITLFTKRAIAGVAKELGVDTQKLTTAINEVKSVQLSANETLIKGEVARGVSQGHLTQAEADALWKLLSSPIG